MKVLLALGATITSIAVSGDTPPGPQSFTCVGTGFSKGYPYGRQDTGKVQLLVTVRDGVVDVADRDRGISSCPEGAECASIVSAEAIRLSIRNVPHHDPLYAASFRLDLRRKTFVNSGGGLDGGWSQKGKCKAVAAGRPAQGR